MAALTVPVPTVVTFDVRVRAGTLADVAAVALRVIAAAGLHAPTKCRVAGTKKQQVWKGIPAAFSEADALARPVTLDLGGGLDVTLYRPHATAKWAAMGPLRGEDVRAIDFMLSVSDAGREGTLSALAAYARLGRALLDEPGLIGACSSWKGDGARCLPEVPVAGTRSQVLVTTDEEVAAGYDDPGSFWSDGWSDVERRGSNSLCIRAIDAADGPALLAKLQDRQWALARAARPGGIRYYLPVVTDSERDIYRSGARTLGMAGLDPKTGKLEMTCAVLDDRHVAGWEIFDLWNVLQDGELDGAPIRGARVVFVDDAVARRERRPLLAAGAEVLAYDAEGELVQITG